MGAKRRGGAPRTGVRAAVAAGAAGCVALLLAGLWYRQERLTALEPRRLERPITWFGDMAAPCTLLLAGDSRVDEWPVSAPPGWRVARLGFPGETAPNIAAAVGGAMARMGPDALAVLAGTNDATLSALQSSTEAEVTLDRAIGSLHRLFAAARAKQVPARILLTIPEPAENGRVRSVLLRGRDRAGMASLNRTLREQAPAWGVQIIDAAELLLDGAGATAADLARDDLHWTPKAYTLLDHVLWPLVQKRTCGAGRERRQV